MTDLSPWGLAQGIDSTCYVNEPTTKLPSEEEKTTPISIH